MSLARAAALFIGLAVSLSGCGFQPLYGRGDGQVATETLRQIRINPIADRPGQILRGLLSDRLQPKGAERARYSLDVNLAEGVSEVAVRRDATSSYSRLRLNGGMVLTDLETRQVVCQNPCARKLGISTRKAATARCWRKMRRGSGRCRTLPIASACACRPFWPSAGKPNSRLL